MTILKKKIKILAMINLVFFQSPGDLTQQIAHRMRARRKELKYSQQELSRRSDVSLGSLKRFEQTGEISLTHLVKIAFALGCEQDFDALFAKKQYRSIQEVLDEPRS